MVDVVNVSKRFDFSPPLGELIIVAFGRINVRPAELTQAHMYQARMAANFVLSEWSNSVPNLWEVGLQSVPLLAGSATYTVPAETVDILDVYVSYGSPNIDRFISRISRTEFSNYPNKAQQGFPTVFWFDRLISPTITLWPVPDSTFDYILRYYSVRQTMDANLPDGLTVEVPFRFLEAFVAYLAWKLAEIYAPQMEQRCEQKARMAFDKAAGQDVESTPMMITPMIKAFYP